MKKIITTCLLFISISTVIVFGNISASSTPYSGTTFTVVWEEIISDEYKMPHNSVSFRSLFSWGKNLIVKAANRTLSDRSDILPQFTKLAHPNGVCLAGKWTIDTQNPYSGYFKEGSEAVIIARASTATTNTKRGGYRAFGMAGKLFPTSDHGHSKNLKTANFFLVDDLGGTMATHYTDVGLTNEPTVTKNSDVIKMLLYVWKVSSAFKGADSNPGIRQVYEVSEFGEKDLKSVITPKWMKVQAVDGQAVNMVDFRDELNVEKHGGDLVFNISVASTINSQGQKNWKRIGFIEFNASIISNSCDHRLHFHHPKWKNELKHKAIK